MATIQLVKASVQGTVYWIEQKDAEARVYTYTPDSSFLLFLGILERSDDKQMMSKSDGCLAGCRVKFRPDLKEALERFSHTILDPPPS